MKRCDIDGFEGIALDGIPASPQDDYILGPVRGGLDGLGEPTDDDEGVWARKRAG